VVAPPELVILFTLAAIIFRKKVIFDFDDTISGRWAKLLVRSATHVVVASHHLETFARAHNSMVTIVPTTVPEKYYSLDIKTHTTPVIGWIGSGKSHLENLKWFAPVLTTLTSLDISFQFLLIGAQGVTELHKCFGDYIVIDELDWANEKEVVSKIAGMDIGIMPQLDTDRARGQASFKLIQYMALGIPAVGSAVGENKYLITHNTNGMLASTLEEWVECLKRLISDGKLRRQLGLAGKETIMKHYTLESQLPVYKKLLSAFEHEQK